MKAYQSVLTFDITTNIYCDIKNDQKVKDFWLVYMLTYEEINCNMKFGVVCFRVAAL